MGPRESEARAGNEDSEVVPRFMRKHGRWDRLINGPEVIKYQDQVFLIIVSIQDPVLLKPRKMFDIGPIEQRLYRLEISG
jgi:hypothetical protein